MLYRIKHWTQFQGEDQAQITRTYIFSAPSDIQVKRYASRNAKFYPEYTTTWKVQEVTEDVQTFAKYTKQKWVKEFNRLLGRIDSSNKPELQRYITIEKALTPNKQKEFEKECNNIPRHAYWGY